MRVERTDHEHYTELRIYRLAHDPWAVYTVICKNMDYDHTTRTFKQLSLASPSLLKCHETPPARCERRVLRGWRSARRRAGAEVRLGL